MTWQSLYCTYCGAKYEANAQFCGLCGTPVKVIEEVPALSPLFLKWWWAFFLLLISMALGVIGLALNYVVKHSPSEPAVVWLTTNTSTPHL